jgi:hypothetical protein
MGATSYKLVAGGMLIGTGSNPHFAVAIQRNSMWSVIETYYTNSGANFGYKSSGTTFG